MLRKCNRLLAHILAFALVITTFGSDLTSAKVFAVASEVQAEEPTVDAPAVDAPAQNEEPVNEEPKAEEPVEKTPDEEVEEPSEEEEDIEIPEGQQPKADTPENPSGDQTTDGQGEVKLSMLQMSEKVETEDSKKVETKGMEGNPVPEVGYFSVTYNSNIKGIESKTKQYSIDKLNEGNFELLGFDKIFEIDHDDAEFVGWTGNGSDAITKLENVENQGSYTVSAMWKIIGTEPDPDTEQKDGIELTGSYGELEIVVEAEKGVLPVNSELAVGDAPDTIVDEINEYVTNNTEGKIEKIDTFDVSVVMTGFGKIQPKGTVNVTVNLKDGTSGKLKLFHFNDDFSEIKSSDNTGTSVTIALDNLSPFALVVVPDEETPDVEEKKVDLDVFVTNGTKGRYNDTTFMQLLGLEEDSEGKYAVGSVSLSEEFVKAGTNDVDTVKKVLSELDKDSLSVNTKNTVGKFADKLTFEYSINGTEEDGYQLVLNITAIETKSVSYIARLYEREDGDFVELAIRKRKYITGSDVYASESDSFIATKRKDNGVEYALNALYTVNGEDVEEYKGFSDIQEDKIVYAKYLPINLDGAIVDSYFFLLKRDKTLKFSDIDPLGEYHQTYDWYFPSGKGYWGGYAKNIDSDDLKGMITYPRPTDYDYKAIFNWSKGLDQSVIGYSFKPGTAQKIQEYIDSEYNAFLNADDERFTLDDIRWYVYKSERGSYIPNHIDGYVTASITYNANTAVSSGSDVTDTDRVKVDDSVTIKKNMFTPADPELVFVGWNTKADGTGTYYFENIGDTKIGDSLKLDRKMVLYAQWIKVPEKYRKIVIQADGEGTDKDTYLPYNGREQSAIVYVKVKAEEIHDNLQSSALKNVMENASDVFMAGIDNLINLCTIVAYAEAPKTSNVNDKGEVAPQTITIGDETDSIDVEVAGLKVNGGKGTNVGDYGVDLVYDDMVINASVNGHKVDIRDKFIIEVTPAGTKETSEETEGKEKTDTICYLHVTPLHIDITTNTHSKQYDGAALSDGTIIYGTSDRFVDGEASISVPNSITDVGSVSNAIVITPLAQKYKDDPELFSGKDGKSNYVISLHPGTLTIYNPGGDTPPSPPTPPTPPVINPPAGQVLGATRAVGGDGAAVLGARRGRTEDSTNTLGRIITIIVAAGIGFTMIFIKRKKSEEE